MCGICALSRAPHSSIPDARRFLNASLVAIQERGFDSTGVAWTRGKRQKVWYHRLVGKASDVAADLEVDVKSRIHSYVGHTRWATHGDVNYTNAHPVVCDQIALVHNGVLSNHADLIAMTGRKAPCEVDSWALAAILASQAELGAEHPAELLELVEGDATVAWLDSDDPTVTHLARLRGRPLTIGWTKRHDLVMSSTPQTLRRTAQLGRCAIHDIVEIPEGTYLAVRDGDVIEWEDFKVNRPKWQTQRPLWTPTKGSPAPVAKLPTVRPKVGITDLVQNRPDDWWDESERLLGDAIGDRPEFEWDDPDTHEWETGEQIVRNRPKNKHGW